MSIFYKHCTNKHNKKYILQACGYAAPYPGNFITSLIALARENKKLGYDTIFIFPFTAKKMKWCQNLEKEYIVYYFPLEKARIKISTYLKFKSIYQKYNIAIAHSHFELYDMPLSLMASTGTKIFWHLHDDINLIYDNSKGLYKLLWKIQYAYASKRAILLSVSEKGKDFAVKLGFENVKAYFVPNAVDIHRLDCERKEGIPKYDFLIFGWDYYRKGLDVLEKAIPIIENRTFSCGVVANDNIEEKAKENNHIVYQKPVDNVGFLYNNTKCFLHISRQEGLSYALLEAIYSGVIVICSDIEQNLFAREFPTVVFIPVGDSVALAKMMELVITDELNITNKDIRKSREMIKEKYSLDSWVKKIQTYYFEK